MAHPRCHLFQWLQLLVVCETEFSNKVVEMLVTGVDVRFCSHVADAVKVVDVHVHKDSEQAGQDLLGYLHEGLGEGSTNIGGEDVLVVDLYLDPLHQQTHVLWGGKRRGPLVFVLVLPAVLVLGPARHDGAALVCAGVADGAVNEVDAVEEVDHVHSHPVIEVLAVRQLDGQLQVQASVQGRLSLLVQLEALGPWLELPLGPERSVFVEDLLQGQRHGQLKFSFGAADDEADEGDRENKTNNNRQVVAKGLQRITGNCGPSLEEQMRGDPEFSCSVLMFKLLSCRRKSEIIPNKLVSFVPKAT